MRDQPTAPTSPADDIALIQAIPQVPLLLDVVARACDMRFTAIARVTEDRWITCASRDEAGYGLKPGDEIDISSTVCSEIRQTRELVVMDDAQTPGDLPPHQCEKIVAFNSRAYASVPIVLSDGSFFGTLCAIDPDPRRLSGTAHVEMLRLFTDLIARWIEAQLRQRDTESALSAAMEAGRLREEFIGVIGHDLRNPVAAISAGLRMLDRAEPARRALLVAEMHKSLHRMSGLIRNLMDFARGRLGGAMELQIRPRADLGRVLQDVTREVEMAMGVGIDTDIRIPGPVPCDEGRIGQLVSNLLVNATTHGDPALPITLAAGIEDGTLRIEIANGGEPIPAAQIATLFEPYRRGGSDTQVLGMGLGLHIAAEIARAHGGRLSVRSSDERTVFTLEMPAPVE